MRSAFPRIIEAFGSAVVLVSAAQQIGSVVQRQRDIALQHDRADLKVTCGHADNPAACVVTRINGFLNRLRLHRNAITDGTEAGVTEPHADTDTDAGYFVADADPETTTDPTVAAPGTIRGDLGRDWGLKVQQNLVHGSDSPESAARELAIWF